jgi:DNA-binding IclR family transcriptional regulator
MARKTANDETARLSGTQSIERALTLMREIAAHNRSGSRLLDLASRTGLQRPTVHRMLKCLTLENMVQQDPDTHRYYLGPMVFELGLTAAPRYNLREICHPALSRIAEATGDTVFLTQRSGLTPCASTARKAPSRSRRSRSRSACAARWAWARAASRSSRRSPRKK